MSLLKQDVKFGTKTTHHDNSIRVTQLSPEQTERLRNGEKYENIITGQEVVTVEPYKKQFLNPWKTTPSNKEFYITFEEYQKLRKELCSDRAILRKLNISSTTLNKFKRRWGIID